MSVLSRRHATAALLAAIGLPAQALETAPENASGPQPEEIGAGLDSLARLTAPVRINGQGPFRFVVDTGSNHSLIADDLARTLGLPETAPVLLNTVAGAHMTPAVMAGEVVLGERVTRDVRMGRAARADIGGAGLLGIDQLGALRLTLDYRRRKLAIGPSGRRAADRGAFVMPATHRAGRLTLTRAWVSNVPVTAFLDSGSEITIGNMALRRRLGRKVRPLVRQPFVPVVGATGLVAQGELGVLPTARLGGMQVRDLGVVFADLHTFALWDMQHEPALLIGVDLLRRFETVDLDFGRSAVIFRLPDITPIQGTRLPGEAGSGDVVSYRQGG